MKLGDLNDYMGMNQDCIQPLLAKGKEKREKDKAKKEGASAETGDHDDGNDADDNADNTKVTLDADLFSGQISTKALAIDSTAAGGKVLGGTGANGEKPSSTSTGTEDKRGIMNEKVSEKSGEVVATIGLSDCLSCSGCITSSEAILLQNQSIGKLRKLLLTESVGPFSVGSGPGSYTEGGSSSSTAPVRPVSAGTASTSAATVGLGTPAKSDKAGASEKECCGGGHSHTQTVVDQTTGELKTVESKNYSCKEHSDLQPRNGNYYARKAKEDAARKKEENERKLAEAIEVMDSTTLSGAEGMKAKQLGIALVVNL